MNKTLVTLAVAVAILACMAPLAQAANQDPGGFKGFLAGCCFGLRTGADYNELGTGSRDYIPWFLVGVCIGPRTAMDYRDGKDWHWREVCRIIPYIGICFAVWDGVDIMNGKVRSDLQTTYGVSYY